MKKMLSMLFGVCLLFATSAQAGGLVGVKMGLGQAEGHNDAYTSGSTAIAAQSETKNNEFGALFAEFELASVEGLSLGLEYIPFTASIRLSPGKEGGTGADVEDYTTLYALYMKNVDAGNVYFKAGYSHADIGTVTNSNSTVNSQDDSLEGPMIGVGFQSDELMNGLVARVEATYTDIQDVSITTTSNGATSVKKTGNAEITTLSVSLAKSF